MTKREKLPARVGKIQIGEGLTLKQELFARAIIQCKGNHSEAYRLAYDTSRSKPETVWRSAHEVAHNPKVQARVQELLSTTVTKHNIDANTVLSMYLETYHLAKLSGSLYAMNRAIDGIARVTGLNKFDLGDDDGEPPRIEYVIPKDDEEGEAA
ncbi:MAG: terminase small subunit [Pseudomonadota bacterium]